MREAGLTTKRSVYDAIKDAEALHELEVARRSGQTQLVPTHAARPALRRSTTPERTSAGGNSD